MLAQRTCAVPGGMLQVHVAADFLRRAVGLLGRAPLAADEALLIVPCASVHTFGMRVPLDVVFLDRDADVIRIRASLRPWRLCGCRRAVATLELRAGAAQAHGLRPGLRLAELHDLLR